LWLFKGKNMHNHRNKNNLATAFILPIVLLAVPLSVLFGEDAIYGGKWDDTWEVFFIIHDADKDVRPIDYIWREELSEPLKKHVTNAKWESNHFVMGSITIGISGKSGMAYGNFGKPRMANLVKLDIKEADLNEAVLEKLGWKRGAIPAESAKEIIEKGYSENISDKGLSPPK